MMGCSLWRALTNGYPFRQKRVRMRSGWHGKKPILINVRALKSAMLTTQGKFYPLRPPTPKTLVNLAPSAACAGFATLALVARSQPSRILSIGLMWSAI